ncbi:MAG: SRPBCC domain-containing protein [Oceanospirillaceae bacterium]|nr:SRPBCC domain-containing protein [Oceanospirillaceae bacterium]
MSNTTDSQSQELTLQVSRVIPAPIEKVFNAWLDPKFLAKFMLPAAGMSAPKVTADAREGGSFSIIMQVGDKQLPHGGNYQKIAPHHCIIFTWESAHSIDGSVVTLNFSTTDQGTLVELIQVKFYDEEAKSAHEGGWDSILLHLGLLFNPNKKGND